MRLIGYSTGAIALFPIVQAVLSALLGAFLAIGVSIAVAPFVNRMFKGEVPGEEIFRLLPEHLAAALALTVGCAVLAASWGGARAARIAPGEGLREE